MAKTQKNVKLPDDVLAWLNEQEDQTGASHSRMILAALLCYIVQAELRPYYMQLAVRLDRGVQTLEGAIEESRCTAGMVLVNNLLLAGRLSPQDKRIEAAVRKCVATIVPILEQKQRNRIGRQSSKE